MQVHDRGTMKWVSLMLPEHVELLQEVFTEHKEKPLLDEQKRLEIDRKLKYSLEHQVTVEMTYFQEGDLHTLTSIIEKIDQWQGCIILANEGDISIPLNNLVDIEVEVLPL